MKNTFIKIFKTLVLVVLMFAINISCTKKRTYVEIVNGKLKVYPTELGLYDSIPYDTISKINESEVYGYDTWRLPTTEELSLLKEKGYLSKKEYMTEENKKGMVLLVTDNLYAKALREKEEKLARAKEYDDWKNGLYNQEHDFIDLGLSVKWASCNVGANSPEEYGEYLEDVWKDDSLSRHVAWRVPSVDEFNELIDKCKWTWTKLNDVNGYDIIGPNGNSIFLPAAGYYGYEGEFYVNEACRYLSSTPAYKGYEWCTYYLWADSSEYHTYLINFRWRPQTVRPVLDPENVSEYMRLGTLAALEDDYDKAIGYYSEVIKVNSDFSPAYMRRGTCFFKLGKEEQAVDDFINYLRINDSWTAFNILLEKSDLYFEVVFHKLKDQCDKYPQNSSWPYYVGAVCDRNEQYGLALKYYKRSYEIEPDSILLENIKDVKNNMEKMIKKQRS